MSIEQVATCIATDGARRFFKDPTTLAGLVSQLHKEGSMPLTLAPVMTSSMFDQRDSHRLFKQRDYPALSRLNKANFGAGRVPPTHHPRKWG